MINVYRYERDTPELAYDPDGLEAMARLIEQRVAVEDIFGHRDLLLELAQASGGHLRQMMRMARQAFLTAMGRGHGRVEADDVTYAINQEQFGFERSISPEQYLELAQAALKKELTDEATGQELLFSTAILEYNGGRRWVYPNPVVRRSEPFQRALNQLIGKS